MQKIEDNSDKKRFNSGLALLTAAINCILLSLFFWGDGGYGEDISWWWFSLVLVIPLQLLLIQKFTRPDLKKGYLIATIITFVLCLIFLFLILLIYALGTAWRN